MSFPLIKNILIYNNTLADVTCSSLQEELSSSFCKSNYAKCQILLNKLLLCIYRKIINTSIAEVLQHNKAYDNFVEYLISFSRGFISQISSNDSKYNEISVLIITLCDILEKNTFKQIPHIDNILTSLYLIDNESLDINYIEQYVIPKCVVIPMIHAVNNTKPTNLIDTLVKTNKYINPYLLDCSLVKFKQDALNYAYTPSASLSNFTYYEFNDTLESKEPYIYILLKNYDWSGKSFKSLLGFFCQLYDPLFIQLNTAYKVSTLAEVCYKFITNDSISLKSSEKILSKQDTNLFLSLVKYLNINRNLTVDTEIFSQFLKFIKIQDSDIIANYLKKSFEEVTANEALIFRKSMFNTMKFVMADEDTETTEEEPIEEDEDNATTEETSLEEETTDDDIYTNDTEDDINNDIADDTSIEKKEPSQDDFLDTKNPFNVLIELGNKTNLSEFLYKQEVIKTIEHLLATQPKNISSQKLLFLKKWVSQWINILSMKSIKDFINKLSIKI